jgi:hypothetical protein
LYICTYLLKTQTGLKISTMKKYTTYQPKQTPQGGKYPGGESSLSYTSYCGSC